MRIIINRSQRGPIDKLLLKQLGEDIRSHKDYLKRLEKRYPESEYYQKRREMRVLHAELRMLKRFVFQIEILQMERKSRYSSMVEQSPRKRQGGGSSPSTGSKLNP